jgi:single-strand DNA-binding protein
MYHKIILVGNLGKDPEMRYTPGGQPVTSFSVASNRRYTDSSGENVEETIWFRISVWGKQAEASKQYLTKGRQVLVEGRLIPDKQTGGPRTWTKPDGTTGASFEVSAETVRFLGQRGETVGEVVGEAPSEKTGVTAPREEEIPF